MNMSEAVALLKLSRDEHIGVLTTAQPLEEAREGARSRPRVHGFRRRLLGLFAT